MQTVPSEWKTMRVNSATYIRTYRWSGEGSREHDETASTTSHTLSTVF